MTSMGIIEGLAVTITEHALQRMVEMRISADEVRAIIASPNEMVGSKKYPGRFVMRGDKFALAAKFEGKKLLIITCLVKDEDVVWAVEEGRITPERLRAHRS